MPDEDALADVEAARGKPRRHLIEDSCRDAALFVVHEGRPSQIDPFDDAGPGDRKARGASFDEIAIRFAPALSNASRGEG